MFFQLSGQEKQKKVATIYHGAHRVRRDRLNAPKVGLSGVCQRRVLHFGCLGSCLSVFSKAAVVCQKAADCSFQAVVGGEGAQVSLASVKEVGRLPVPRLSQADRF